MNKVLLIHLAGALAALTGNALHAQDVTGDWQGTIKAGPAELRIQIHITKSDKGLAATMDSVDQGANGIPVDSVTLTDSTLKFGVGIVQGTYEGKVSADGNSISGNWTQGQAMPLNFTRGTFKKVEHKPGKPSDIDGAWKGSIDTPAGTLQVVFTIVNTEDGLTATVDIPDQGAKGLPVSTVTRNGQTLKMEMKQFGGGFEGTLSPDLKTVTGTFGPAGNALPLVLKR
jgi:hypothetical protein